MIKPIAKVVLADDNEVVRASLRLILRTEGFEVVGEARDGQAAIDLVCSLSPNLVCLDIQMPRKGGFETLEELKREFPALPVIMISVSTDREGIDRALELGADGYITKPFNAVTLSRTLKRALGIES